MAVKFLVHDNGDAVGVAIDDITPDGSVAEGRVQATGETVEVVPTQPVPYGHKIAVTDIPDGEGVIKYGVRIGVASQAINAGDHVHTHNVKGERWK